MSREHPIWLEDALHTVFMFVASGVGGAASVARFAQSPESLDIGDWIISLSYLMIAATLVLDLRSKVRRLMERRQSRRLDAVREVLGS